MIWLDEDISPADTPEGVKVKLFGIYSEPNVTIYVIIDYKGTEYRLSRYHKRTTTRPTKTNLERRFHRTVQGFIHKYGHAPFRELLERFLEWSENPATEVLRELLPAEAKLGHEYPQTD